MNKLSKFFSSIEGDKEIVVGTDSLESVASDVHTCALESETDAEIVEELEGIASGLESIVELLDSDSEDNKPSVLCLQSINMAAETHTKRLGVESLLSSSMESLSEENQLEVSTEAEDKIKDTIKKVWEAIKAAVKKAIESAKALFSKIFGAIPKLEKRVEVLSEAIKDVEKTGSEGKIKVNGKRLALNGKVGPKEITSGLNNLESTLADVYGTVIDSSKRFYKDLGTMELVTDDDHTATFNKLRDALKEKTKILSKNPLPGGWTLSETSKEVAGIPFKNVMFVVDEKESSDAAVEMDPLTTGEMKKVLSQVSSVVKRLKTKKDAVESLGKLRSNLIEKMESNINKMDLNKVEKSVVNASLKPATYLTQLDVAVSVRQITSISFAACRESLAVVERSIKAHGVEIKVAGLLPAPTAA